MSSPTRTTPKKLNEGNTGADIPKNHISYEALMTDMKNCEIYQESTEFRDNFISMQINNPEVDGLNYIYSANILIEETIQAEIPVAALDKTKFGVLASLGNREAIGVSSSHTVVSTTCTGFF